MKRYNFTNPLFLFKIQSMMRRLFFLLSLSILVTCDDGDILTATLDFDKELGRCDNNLNSYLLFDTRTDPNESLTLVIPRTEETENYFINPNEGTLLIDESTVRFNYRTYNSNPAGLLCDVLNNSDLIVREDYEADSGTVFISSTIVDDDNDNIPSVDEYGPGGLANPQDSDGDGIPDYLDEDDDNDNVKTRNELDNENLDGDDNPLTNPLDTDGDDIPNYLDDDDDGDNVLTRLEDFNGNLNPRDDFVFNTEGIEVARYLYNLEATPFDDPGFIFNVFSRTVTTHFLVSDIDLQILRATEVDLGTYENSFNITNEPQED
jgi:hypothetical protein